MSKERLEEVIELMCESYHDYLVADNTKRSEVRYKSYLDCKEIIKSEFEKQAERVQELEKEIMVYESENRSLAKEREALRQRVQKLEESE